MSDILDVQAIEKILPERYPLLLVDRILELEPGAAEQPDSRGKNFLHPAIIKGDLESLLFLISINVNVQSKTTDSHKLSPLLLAVQVRHQINCSLKF